MVRENRNDISDEDEVTLPNWNFVEIGPEEASVQEPTLGESTLAANASKMGMDRRSL
jgi:hypothetical protein